MIGKFNITAILVILPLLFCLPFNAMAENGGEPGPASSEEGGLLRILEAEPHDIAALSALFDYWTTGREFAKAIEFTTEWLAKEADAVEETEDAGDNLSMLVVYANTGQYYMATDNVEDAKNYLDKSLALLNAMPADMDNVYYRDAFYTLHNSFGVYYVNVEMNYHKAISYFFKGFETAEKYGDHQEYAILGANLVITYWLRNDSSGLPYALRIYEYGKDVNNKHITFCGAQVSAIMYYVIGDYKKALEFIEESASLLEKFYEEVYFYNVYANILKKNGFDKKAEEYYLKALNIIKSADPSNPPSATTTTSVYLNYGEYLVEKKQYNDAIDMFLEGINVATRKRNYVFRYRLFQNLSSAYRSIGYPEKALDYYIVYHEEADSIFNIERERSINELQVKYETEKHEREVEQSKLELVRQSRRFQAVLFILFIIAILAVAIYLLYRYKNMLYIRLLKQHQETLSNERRLQNKLYDMKSEYDSNANTHPADVQSVKADSKNKEIYSRLEELMQTQHTYREQNLTVERVSKMLNTNRTYLSQAINDQTGLSFNYYINSYRITEAVRILSDPEDNTPLKTLCYELGFHSLSTFYKLFNSVIGIPPSKFRENSKSGQEGA